jgi:hypothetical protein
VGPGKPPLHTRFRKGQSGNPRGRSAKDLPVLLADALNEPVYLTTNGHREEDRRRTAAPRTSPVDRGGRGGDASLVERVRRQVLAEIAAKNAAEMCDPCRVDPS